MKNLAFSQCFDLTFRLCVCLVSPVGSGKTALTLALCRALRDNYNIGELRTNLPLLSLRSTLSTFLNLLRIAAVVTNDIFTREDQEFLIRNGALPAERIKAIETGGCPHAAIREDISANLGALEELQAKFACELLLVESGGDNLAGVWYSRRYLSEHSSLTRLPTSLAWSGQIANYSRELADYIIYVVIQPYLQILAKLMGYHLAGILDRCCWWRQDSSKGRTRHLPIRSPCHQQGLLPLLHNAQSMHKSTHLTFFIYTPARAHIRIRSTLQST